MYIPIDIYDESSKSNIDNLFTGEFVQILGSTWSIRIPALRRVTEALSQKLDSDEATRETDEEEWNKSFRNWFLGLEERESPRIVGAEGVEDRFVRWLDLHEDGTYIMNDDTFNKQLDPEYWKTKFEQQLQEKLDNRTDWEKTAARGDEIAEQQRELVYGRPYIIDTGWTPGELWWTAPQFQRNPDDLLAYIFYGDSWKESMKVDEDRNPTAYELATYENLVKAYEEAKKIREGSK